MENYIPPSLKSRKMTKQLNYEEAMAELKQIMQEVQQPDISLDVLEEKMKRAQVLLAQCKDKLRNMETELK